MANKSIASAAMAAMLCLTASSPFAQSGFQAEQPKMAYQIASKVRRFIVWKNETPKSESADVSVLVTIDGKVLSIERRGIPSNEEWQAVVEKAILQASPLPILPSHVCNGDECRMAISFRSRD